MTADEYVNSIINKYNVKGDVDALTKILVVDPLLNIIKEWAGIQLNNVYYSGSRAKGTAINLSSDIDLFISLKSDTTNTLKEIYTSLYNKVVAHKITARKQNVSIGVNYGGHSIDLVPGKKHLGNTNDHSLYRSKVDTWTKTNINNHINLVKASGRLSEIIAMKIWSKLQKLDFPSIYLELTVIEALYNKNKNQPANNFITVLEYLRDSFVDKTIIDPSNSNNIISDDLYKYEKEAIAKKAKESRNAQSWGDIIW
ncbi:nucleotidyltransferase domain-containing protein [Petroclostridium sp. X23]|uniref:nucleotidyltransferase domain-containing protein n=1 Tax=Petroclostridium sp. X23 TaxID=3045146 RepID=UPI0024AE6A9D|nr:nucleotidyltransferase domain-containing protein [Petroclostridium sp. X23]WHH59785.1 nucleotidyltransferase domain-containing protein [Petroclostridium sp. X23]